MTGVVTQIAEGWHPSRSATASTTQATIRAYSSSGANRWSPTTIGHVIADPALELAHEPLGLGEPAALGGLAEEQFAVRDEDRARRAVGGCGRGRTHW